MDYCDIPPIRKTFYIFNFIFGASGVALTVAGSVVTWRLSSSAASSFLPLAVLAPPAFIIALGLLSLISLSLSVHLCTGSGNIVRSKKHELSSGKKWKAVLYAAVVSGVAFAELITGSVSLSARKHYNRALREAMEESLYTYPNSSYAKSQWDVMQQKLQCCGVFSPGEWLSHPLMTQLPYSCCEIHSTELCSFLWGHEVFHSGCFRKIRKVVDSATVTIGGLSVALAVIKILLSIFAILLSRAAVKRYTRV